MSKRSCGFVMRCHRQDEQLRGEKKRREGAGSAGTIWRLQVRKSQASLSVPDPLSTHVAGYIGTET